MSYSFPHFFTPTQKWLDTIGNEVFFYVSFVDGDPNAPVIVGCTPKNNSTLYNKNTTGTNSIFTSNYNITIDDENKKIEIKDVEETFSIGIDPSSIELRKGDKTKVSLTKDTVTASVDSREVSISDKISITEGSVSVKSLLDDVLSIISKIQVTTPVGVSGTPIPTTITAIEKAKVNISKLLK
ncbi:hypothetical protein [Flammeovirga agarivorans]|uniref:Gp5/Type VI secretion system Vgr protein OB-fold domain-containing protein n=1 Tax=Flammeovirga agarivorans TaxID=2726742 RepID=A0A7X8XZ57_9BACT|nr:hypothetical protein [Flammeovirga agarivorans]NLR94861.1 hypothetical protein [Flammeovirga agarivorans]